MSSSNGKHLTNGINLVMCFTAVNGLQVMKNILSVGKLKVPLEGYVYVADSAKEVAALSEKIFALPTTARLTSACTCCVIKVRVCMYV